MELQEITALLRGENAKIREGITELQKRITEAPDVDSYTEQWDPESHDVMNASLRPNKSVKYFNDEGVEVTKIEAVARIAIAMQKIIVNRAVAFLFGNPVKITCQDENDESFDLVKKVLKKAKINSINQEVARELFRSTEVAEYWWMQEVKGGYNGYGVDALGKMKVSIFKPSDGNELFPRFNDIGDMIAFSRQYNAYDSDNKKYTYFEIFTDTEYWLFQNASEGWKEVKYVKHDLGKIPVIYASQEKTEWYDVQGLIDRLEKLLSNFADTNDYHASPTLAVKGKVAGFSSKGEQGKIIEIEQDGDLKYVSWNRAPESVKIEIDNLLRLIYSLTQTPDISFESVKGIGGISGIALRMMFLDAHLKVMNKQEIFDEYLERRMSVVKQCISRKLLTNGKAVEDLDIDCAIEPFMLTDLAEQVKTLIEAGAGKAVVSQKTAVKLAGLVDNADDEYQQLKDEESQAVNFEQSELTV